ncbi:hypothetical protein HFP89_07380 [Wenzhouxiangella sp. XN79A]|uniref:DUF6164 family protein n=1 Tax=Wenzhouxiangella sp. XN79A TaxID=2724193 RepID=UPI00144AE15C|nr:DUF6164 family protein [Wenzhouxiangella sp. XN79A]NKI34983.1 hypothetical protein [Wenzhouxiangella sp. XN79A]
MARRIMNLRNVPADEADAVRALLAELDVAWYETPPTAFGLSAGGIWIRNDADYARVREAYDRFQAEWTERARRSTEPRPPLATLQLLGALLAAGAILAVMAWPIIQLMR